VEACVFIGEPVRSKSGEAENNCFCMTQRTSVTPLPSFKDFALGSVSRLSPSETDVQIGNSGPIQICPARDRYSFLDTFRIGALGEQV